MEADLAVAAYFLFVMLLGSMIWQKKNNMIMMIFFHID